MNKHDILAQIKAQFGFERVLWHDYETFSRVDIKAAGAAVYAEHPSTEIILGSWAFDNDPVKMWDKYGAETGYLDGNYDPPNEYLEALEDPDVLKVAWNAAFEHVIMKNVLGITVPFEHQMDPMINAYYLSFEGKMEKVGQRVGLKESEQKLKAGRQFINTFTKSAKPTKTMPDRDRIWPWNKRPLWDKGRQYVVRDTEAMRSIMYRLQQHPMPQWMWEDWYLDRAINERGVPVNKAMATNAMRLYEQDKEEKIDFLKHMTGLDNPNSNAQMLEWLKESGEYKFDNMQKGSIGRTLNEPHLRPTSNTVIQVLETKRELAKTSVTKFRRFRDGCCEDGTVKQSLQFGGAQRTFRWGGRMIQPQNLKKPGDEIAKNMPEVAGLVEHGELQELEMFYGDGMDALSQSIRGCIQAPEGYTIIDADLSAIENVVLGWSAEDDKILDAPRTGKDSYLSFGVNFYKQPYETLWEEYKLGNKLKRTVCKPAVLGCGYQLGAGHRYIDDKTGEEEATGLLGYAKGMGIILSDKEAQESVRVWRDTYRDAVQFWFDIEQAALECLRTGKPRTVGPVRFDVKGKFLRLRLPSGRHLHYYRAHIKEVEFYGKMRDNVHYYGLKEGKWCLQKTYGGKFTENICQAIARDILMHGLRLAVAEGLDIFLHIHDQICGLSKIEVAEDQLKILEQCMRERPDWSGDIPLGTGGTITTHLSKD